MVMVGGSLESLIQDTMGSNNLILALYIILCKCRIRDSEMSLVFSLLLIL